MNEWNESFSLKNKKKGLRHSLRCPQSVDNLNTLHNNVSDFEMTQSLYEVTGKKEKLEKMAEETKLMNLIASEKAANILQKKRLRKMKKKINEQRKRNEEKQKIVEDRKIQITKYEEEKRQKILNKMNKSIIGKTDFIKKFSSAKVLINSTHNFLENRPHSSTGNIFGFGSSTPRLICDSIKDGKITFNNKITTNKNESKIILEKETHRTLSNFNQCYKTQKITPKSIKKVSPVNVLEVSYKKGAKDTELSKKIRKDIPSTQVSKSVIMKEKHYRPTNKITKDIQTFINKDKTSSMEFSSNTITINPNKSNPCIREKNKDRFQSSNETFDKTENVKIKRSIKDISNDNDHLLNQEQNMFSKKEKVKINITKDVHNNIPIMQIIENKESEKLVEEGISEKLKSEMIPDIEISNDYENMTLSTDDLDRLERRRRLESIMSRVKKESNGSTDNVSHCMTSTALQNMMDKGHLTGMSKTAAVLMRNSHRLSDFGNSVHIIEKFDKTIRTSISTENFSHAEDNEVFRGDCDGREDSSKETNKKLEIKSNIVEALSSNRKGSFLSWKEKYSLTDSLDSATDISDGI